MRKSVNIYFNNDISCKDKLETIKKIGYDEFFTGIYDKNEDMSWKDQILYGQSIGLECSMIHCSYFEPDLNYFWKEGKKGEIIFYLDGLEVVSLATLKKTDEKKICTLLVNEDYQKKGYSKQILEDSFDYLDTDKPLITIPTRRLDEFRGIISAYDWQETFRTNEYYSEEVIFNSPKSLKKIK